MAEDELFEMDDDDEPEEEEGTGARKWKRVTCDFRDLSSGFWYVEAWSTNDELTVLACIDSLGKVVILDPIARIDPEVQRIIREKAAAIRAGKCSEVKGYCARQMSPDHRDTYLFSKGVNTFQEAFDRSATVLLGFLLIKMLCIIQMDEHAGWVGCLFLEDDDWLWYQVFAIQ